MTKIGQFFQKKHGNILTVQISILVKKIKRGHETRYNAFTVQISILVKKIKRGS